MGTTKCPSPEEVLFPVLCMMHLSPSIGILSHCRISCAHYPQWWPLLVHTALRTCCLMFSLSLLMPVFAEAYILLLWPVKMFLNKSLYLRQVQSFSLVWWNISESTCSLQGSRSTLHLDMNSLKKETPVISNDIYLYLTWAILMAYAYDSSQCSIEVITVNSSTYN